MKKAEIISINICPVMGAPMESQDSISLIQDKGLAGDRYAEGKGAYSKAPRKNVPPELNQDRDIVRDISIIAEEAILAANEEFGTDFTFGETRRNVLVRGMEDLRLLIGVIFTIGGVAMLGIEACDPCDRPSKLSGKKGFNEAFQNRGGLRARVLMDGEIRVGDSIEVAEEIS
jgi:hypothetical protein